MSHAGRESAGADTSLNYTRRESQAWIALPKGHYNVSSGQYMTNADSQRAEAGAALYNASRAKREAKHAELQSLRGQLAKFPHASSNSAFETPEEAYGQSIYVNHATPPRPDAGDASNRSPSPGQQESAEVAFDQYDADSTDRPALFSYAQEIEQRIASM